MVGHARCRGLSWAQGVPEPRSQRNTVWQVITAFWILLLAPVLFGSIYVYRVEPTLRRVPATKGPPSNLLSTPFIWPGIVQPPTRPAAEAFLEDDTEVIGISVAGVHRAYEMRAFDGPLAHVVNDLVGGVPVSVTRCDLSACARVFTADQDGPLELGLGGIMQGRMLLRLPQGFYFQDSAGAINESFPAFPYSSLPFEVTTWGAWRDAHPDTDVYVRDMPIGPEQAESDNGAPLQKEL